jgi:pyruvate kinase
VDVGDPLLIDDGKIELVVLRKASGKVTARVVHGGLLTSHKGVNLPFTKISMPSLTDKDRQDLQFAMKHHVEWIGLSFVRKATDIASLKKLIEKGNGIARVIAKIEKPEALRDIDNIIEVADGLMVARGDLGVEIEMEKVPVIQKMLVKKGNQACKPIIIATQMMESMTHNYRPTRAESNDVANAVFDGADALMLSGETSIGHYPVQVVEEMQKIIRICEEESTIYNRYFPPETNSPSFMSDSICYNACLMAEQSGAQAVIAMTHSGYTAFRISSQRPRAEIFIFTDYKPLLNMLSLVWGVRCFYYNKYHSTDRSIHDIKAFLFEKQCIRKGDIVINVASMPLKERGTANTIKLSLIG